MKLRFLQITLVSLMLSIGSIANAGIIGSTIWKPGGSSTTFDLWYFTANTNTEAVFDINSWGEGNANNYNGGDYMINSMIWLLRNDGALDQNSILASNNDFNDLSVSGTDGSTSHFDSYISMELLAGNYVLIVGSVNLAANEPSFSDLDFSNNMQTNGTVYHYDGIGHLGDNISYGDYGLTYSGVQASLTNPVGAIPSVPEPSSLAIFILGVIGLTAKRLKKQ